MSLGNGRRALIAGQKSGMVHAIDPDRQGEILWQRRIGKGGKLGGIQWGISADATNVYAPVSDVGITGPPPGGEGGQPTLFGIPLMLTSKDGGGLYALNAKTGEIAWRAPHPGCDATPGCSPAQSGATTVIPGVVFSGGLDGHLRGYDMKDGHIIWDMNTIRSYETVNGVTAKGGSLDGSGAGRRRRHALRELGLHLHGAHPRQRAARVFDRRPIGGCRPYDRIPNPGEFTL